MRKAVCCPSHSQPRDRGCRAAAQEQKEEPASREMDRWLCYRYNEARVSACHFRRELNHMTCCALFNLELRCK